MTLPLIAVLGRGVVPVDEPVLRGDDLGVVRGDGVFETARVARGRAVLLDAHLRRMRRSATAVGIPLPPDDAWTALVAEVIAAAGVADASCRLVCTRGPEGGEPVGYALLSRIHAALAEAREQGIHVLTLSFGTTGAGRGLASPWLLGGVKTTSYAVAMAAQREAEQRGANDVIWVTADGLVLEGATSNVVWVRDGRAFTPPDDTGILAGTTLAAIAPVADIEVRAGTVEDLRGADELALTSSIRGVAPVLTLDGQPVGDGAVGPVTAKLRAAYEDLCAGGA